MHLRCVPFNRLWTSTRPDGKFLHSFTARSVCNACWSGGFKCLFSNTCVLFFVDSFVLCASSCVLVCTAMHPCPCPCVNSCTYVCMEVLVWCLLSLNRSSCNKGTHWGYLFAAASLPVQAHVAPFLCKSLISGVCLCCLLKSSWCLLTGSGASLSCATKSPAGCKACSRMASIRIDCPAWLFTTFVLPVSAATLKRPTAKQHFEVALAPKAGN